MEHVGRNTAVKHYYCCSSPCILKKIIIMQHCFLTADHIIQDIEAFQKAINTAIKHQKGRLVTFGVNQPMQIQAMVTLEHPMKILITHIRLKSLLKNQIKKLLVLSRAR